MISQRTSWLKATRGHHPLAHRAQIQQLKSKKQRRIVHPPDRHRAEVRFLVDWGTPSRIAIARANANAFVVKVDSTRRFTVPKAMRDCYDIQAGDEYRVERSSGDTILVFPARSGVRAATKRK